MLVLFKVYTWLTFCVAVWGSNFVFGKILVQDFSSAMLTMLRLLFIVICLLMYSFFKRPFKRVNLNEFLMIVILGIVGVFINQWSFFEGLQTADPTTSALILATTPILTGFLAAVFLKEKLTIRMCIGSIVAILGIYFVVTKGGSTSLQFDKGLLWIIVTMVTFSIMIIMTRTLSLKLDSLTVTLYSNVTGFIISIPFVFLLDKPIRVSSEFPTWLFLIATAIVVHGIATLAWNSNIRYIDASKASMLSNLEPFIAMLMGVALLSKAITGVEILGALFIVGGVVLSTFQRKKLSNSTISNR